jgi:hypothetical protein
MPCRMNGGSIASAQSAACSHKFDNWWHNGSLPGTSTIAVRTHSGFCWAAFGNSRRLDAPLDRDLDNLVWDMVRQVKSWHA